MGKLLGRGIIACALFGLVTGASAQVTPRPMDQGLKNAAYGATVVCNYPAWESAANAYKAHHPELPNIFGVVQLPADFPSYPFPCNPQTAAARPAQFPALPGTATWAGPASWGPLAWGPVASDSAPSGLYLGGSFSAGRGAYDRSQSQLITLNIVDPTDSSSRTGTSSYVSGGLIAGMNLLTFHQIAATFGVEAAYEWADKNDAFLGNVPNTTLGANTDRLSITRNNLFSIGGTFTVPINRSASIIASGGWARSAEDLTIDCNSSCVAAGTPTFRSVQSHDFDGWYWGVGVQGRIGSMWQRPVFLRGEFRQYRFEGATLSAGTPATAFISAHVEPRIDQVRASVIVPLFVAPPPP